jgi:hypothetical protein
MSAMAETKQKQSRRENRKYTREEYKDDKPGSNVWALDRKVVKGSERARAGMVEQR